MGCEYSIGLANPNSSCSGVAPMETMSDFAPMDTTPHQHTANRKAMVVDDDDDFRFLLCARLERLGIKCFEAENGEVARFRLRNNHVDLVITDNHMPKMNGLELIDWLQKTQRPVVIIFVSGDLSRTIRQRAENARVYAIFKKPCSLAEISLKVQEAFGDL
jgi:CheY-like chemotaxis protein